MKKVCMPVRFIPKETCGCVIECICVPEDVVVDIGPTRTRKKFYYMNFNHVEFGDRLNDLELLTREMLLVRHGWDCMVFWFDLQEGLNTLLAIERTCFVSNLIEGYTETEIASRLGISQAAVSQQLKKAKEKLKLFLADAYKNP